MKALAVGCILIYFSPIIMMMIAALMAENKKVIVKVLKTLERRII